MEIGMCYKSRLFSHQRDSCQTFTSTAAAKSLQSCPTLCDPIDGSPPGSPSLGFSRQEHWSGLPFPSPMQESEKWKWKWSRVRLFMTPWTAACQAPPPMGFSRQEYWSGVPLPSPLPAQHCLILYTKINFRINKIWNIKGLET